MDTAEVVLRGARDYPFFAFVFQRILDKDGRLVPFRLNRAQQYVHEAIERQLAERGWVRALVLKGRQQGISTYLQGRIAWRMKHRRGVKAYVIAHELKASENLFAMANRFHEHTPAPLKPSTGKANAKELWFDVLDSRYEVATAGTKETGRSGTAQYLHASEYAFWQDAESHWAGLGQTVPLLPGTELVVETTANGVNNDFFRRWKAAIAGKSDYVAIFVPWFWQTEYTLPLPKDWRRTPEEDELIEVYGKDGLTDEHLVWRRWKIANDFDGDVSRFQQEYPCIAAGTRVGTGSGLVPIEQVRVGNMTAYGRVLAVLDKGKKETVRLTTALGYEIVCTPEHRILTADGWIEARHCVGRSVVLSSGLLASWPATVCWNAVPAVESRLAVSPDLGRWLGYFMGDGSVRNGVVSFACDARDEETIADIVALSRSLFGVEPQLRRVGSKRGGVEVRFGSAATAAVLDRLECVEHLPGSRTRRRVCVPEAIWRSPPDVVRQFLRGLFEADGWCGPQVKLFAKGRQFASDVQRLLLAFGITSRLRSATKRAGNGAEYLGHELCLRSHEAAAFMRTIGFVSARKSAGWSAPKRDGSIEMVDTVVSIEPAGVSSVFDLEIEGSHRFDAGGIVVHNCNWREAFVAEQRDTFIPGRLVVRAQANQSVVPSGPLLVGVDPARYGDDRTAIAVRQGRKVRAVRTYEGKNTMEVAGIVARFIEAHNPAAVFVDVIGIGAGVYDRLVELGYAGQDDPERNIVIAVNVAEAAINDDKYVNRRAEIWAALKAWLEAYPCSLPDSDEILADLTAPGYTYDSSGRLRLESKEQMKKRGEKSPDIGDAIALTFAEPVRPRDRGAPRVAPLGVLDEVVGY